VSLYDGANGPERGSGGRGGPGESAPYDEPGAGANERTAKASPADFRAVFDDAPAPLVVITPDDYVIVAANEAFQRATLTDCSRLLGKRIFDVFPGTVNAATVDGQRELSEGLQQIYSSRRSGVLPTIRYDIPNPDAPDGHETRWWSQAVAPLLDHQGEVAFLISQLEDVTQAVQPGIGAQAEEDPEAATAALREANVALVRELEVRRRAESQLRRAAELDAYRLRLAEALRRNTEPAPVIREALRLLGEQLRADYAYFSEVDEVAGTYRIDQTFARGDLDSLEGTYPIAAYGAISERLRLGETCVIGDTALDPTLNDTTRQAMLSHGIVSSVSTSLVSDGRWLAILNVHSNTPRTWSETDVALVVETADRTWAAYERARAEDQLRHNAETFHSIVKHVPFGMFTVDADLRILHASPTAQRTFGLPNLIGADLAHSLRSIWPEPFASVAIDRFQRTLSTGEPFVSVDTVESRGDRETTEAYDWRLECITMGDGRRGVVCYYYDLTQKHHLERLLKESSDRQAFLLRLADALHGLDEPDAIVKQACRLLGASLEVNRVIISRVDDDRFLPLGSFSKGVPRLPVKRYPVDEFGPVFGDIAEGVEVMVDDVRAESSFTRQEQAVCSSLQVRALASVAIPTGSQVAGRLTLHHATPRPWSRLELDLMLEVAFRVGSAMERAKNHLDLRRLNDSLQAQIAARTLELRRSEAVRKAIQETLAEATNFRRSMIERLNGMKSRGSDRGDDGLLTPRERQVLARMAAGKSDEAISIDLGIARRTVRNHVTNIYAKLSVRTRSQAIVWAQERGVAGLAEGTA